MKEIIAGNGDRQEELDFTEPSHEIRNQDTFTGDLGNHRKTTYLFFFSFPFNESGRDGCSFFRGHGSQNEAFHVTLLESVHRTRSYFRRK